MKQEAINSPSSILRRAILEGGKSWGGIVRDLRNVNKENRRSKGSWCLIPQHYDSHDVMCSRISDISCIDISKVFLLPQEI